MSPLSVGADQARRFLVLRHLLAPPRSLPAKPASVLTVVERLGLLQFDPLEVPGARSHDLVLHARIRGYRRGWCEQWLYGPDRRLIELYNKSLNMLPIGELPHYAIAWERSASYYADRILREQKAVADAIVDRITADGPLSTAAFAEHGHSVDWWWAPTRASRAVMEALFVTGRLGIARREGNRRHYDLIERLFPPEVLARREPEEDAMRHRLLSRYRAIGLTAPAGSQGDGDVMWGAGGAVERRRRTAELVDAGVLVPVEVEGVRGVRYMLSKEQPILAAAARPLKSAGVSFIGPLDPIVWHRGQLRELWGFSYLWEVYVPAARRRWGYYVLPLLFGERFVGRIEPRLDRKTKTLGILGAWFEDGFEPMDEPGFIRALSEAMEAYRAFVGATKVVWPRTRAGRDLAAALKDARQG